MESAKKSQHGTGVRHEWHFGGIYHESAQRRRQPEGCDSFCEIFAKAVFAEFAISVTLVVLQRLLALKFNIGLRAIE
ncbi:MAG: hypothetical protein NT138_27365 [Planctomycetales bacterium]|jgi:hypothetical protein|nr:hypothetical protein [Planctomycetales bacterium]